MIHVKRPRQQPPVLESDAVSAARAQLTERADGKGSARQLDVFDRKNRYGLGADVRNSLRDALSDLFHGKCAYCETQLQRRGIVEAFRPAADALDHEGTSSERHYWWLQLEWSNLLPSCKACNASKRSAFPVAGKRMREGASRLDRAALLDPTRDRPEHHLVFGPGGEVRPHPDSTPMLGTTRGDWTIRLLALSRRELVAARKKVAGRTLSVLKRLADGPSQASREEALHALLDPAAPHTAVVRQLVARHLVDQPDSLPASLARKLRSELRVNLEALQGGRGETGDTAQARGTSRRPTKKAVRSKVSARPGAAESQPRGSKVAESATRADTSAPSTFSSRAETIYLERMEITNFKAIKRLSLVLRPDAAGEADTDDMESDADRADWLMLLGENGAGKSTVLQAIACVLLGDALQDHPDLDHKAFVRRGARSATLRLTLSNRPQPYVLHITAGGRCRFSEGVPPPSLFVRGYGAVRLLPEPGLPSPRSVGGGRLRVHNLFRASVPLANARDWLEGIDDPRRWEAVRRSLHDLLLPGLGASAVERARSFGGDGAGEWIVDRDDAGRFTVDARPLSQASDGFRTVIAFCCDIMHDLDLDISDMHAATGIVLIDEIGTHLHPAWKMHIVESLRSAFPGMQFIATTHDPLCLRGLRRGETTLMHRVDDGDGVQVSATQTGLPDPSSMRVDQLLTSELFGMGTTIDPGVDALFAEYYHLLATPSRTAADEARLADLRGRVDRHNVVLGYTRRDQMVYELIDQFLVDERRAVREGRPPRERRQVADKTRRAISDLWRFVELRRRPSDS